MGDMEGSAWGAEESPVGLCLDSSLGLGALVLRGDSSPGGPAWIGGKSLRSVSGSGCVREPGGIWFIRSSLVLRRMVMGPRGVGQVVS